MQKQRCGSCREWKPLADYCRSSQGRNGTYCRPCSREAVREWRIKKYGPPRTKRAVVPKPKRPLSTTYGAVHARIRKELGKASEYYCEHCGGDAQEWAYDHKDPNEVTGRTARGHVVKYSLSSDHYIALCCPCHEEYDRGRGSVSDFASRPTPHTPIFR